MNKIQSILTANKKIVLIGLGLLLFFALTYVGILSWGSIRLEQEHYIVVTGTSTQVKKNEIARYTAGVTVIDSDKSKAVSGANEKSNVLVASVKKFGVLDADIKTTNLNIYQEQEAYYADGVQKYRLANWHVDLSLEVTLRDITKASALAQLLAGLDTSNLYGPNFSLDETNSNDSDPLAQALKNAREKADVLARVSGKKIGPLIRVIENSNYATPVMYDKLVGMGGGGPAMEAGSTTVSKTVTATYALY